MNITLIMNILVHVLILFCFLYIFFFLFISKREESVIGEQISNISTKNLPIMLKEIDDADTHKIIKWNIIGKKAQDILDSDTTQSLKKKNANNNSLMVEGIIIITTVIFLIYIFYKHVDPKALSFWSIIVENFWLFLVIGIIEYVFFIYTASKYVPSYPNDLGNSIINTLKTRLEIV